VGDFELARRHCVYTFNIATTVTVTIDAKVIKVKRLGVSIKQKTVCMPVFKRAYKQYHR
jgi:hypothetical protein